MDTWFDETVFAQLLNGLANVSDDELRQSLIEQVRALQQSIKLERNANEHYRAEKERQAQELLLLTKARVALSREFVLHDVFRTIVESIAETFGYTLVSLYLVQDLSLVLQHQVGYAQVIENIPITSGVSGKVVRTGQPVLLRNVHDDPAFLEAIDGIVSEICVPFFDNQQVVGILNVESIAGQLLDERDLNLMLALSEHIAIAIQRARLFSALRESHQQYQSVLENIGEVVYQSTLDGRFLYLNSAWTIITGFSVQESLGRYVYDYNYPEDNTRAIGHRTNLLSGMSTSEVYQTRITTKDGGFKWVQINARPFHNPHGELIGTTGTLIDITERMLAEERERDQRLFSDTLRDVSALMTTTLDLGAMLDHVSSCVTRVTQYAALAISMIEHRQLRPVRGYGYLEHGVHKWEQAFFVSLDELTQTEQLVLIGQTMIVDQLELHPELLRGIALDWVVQRLYVPIRAFGDVIGLIVLDYDLHGKLSNREGERVLAIADQVGMALRNAELHMTLRQHAADLQLRVAERTAELRRAHVRLEALLNASSDAILVVNMEGEIVQYNPAFCQLFATDCAQVVGRTFIAFVEPNSHDLLNTALVAVFTEGQRQRVELTVHSLNKSDNQTFVVDALIDPMAEQDLVVCSLRDITSRLQMEKGLRQALDEERKLVELKSQFGVTVSHEFRTPLAAIQTSTELLERYFSQLSATRRDELFENIRHQIDYMTQVIDNILLVSKADTIGLRIDWQMIDLLQLCTTIVQEMQWLAGEDHSLIFTHNGELSRARMDPYLIRRILVNLLSNAVKYSRPGENIALDLSTNGQDVFIGVHDQGIGIPPNDLDHLFESFRRASNVGSIPGTGIGLAIVKRAVELHHGSITVSSQQGVGTSFFITLPLFGG